MSLGQHHTFTPNGLDGRGCTMCGEPRDFHLHRDPHPAASDAGPEMPSNPGLPFTPGATITLHLRGTTIGPDDKVIINLPEAHSEWAQELIRVANDTLGPDRVLVICGDGVQVIALAPEPPRTWAVCTCQAANNGILEPPAEGCPVHGARP